MASDRQLQANRANAKSSTGPRTEDGKARSRMNAYKHGLTAETVVIGNEDPEQFDLMRDDLLARYQPRSPIASALVERLAALLWRMRRVPAFEAAVIAKREASAAALESSGPHDVQQELCDAAAETRSLGAALVHDSAFGDTLGKLARHDAALMNEFRKTLHTLRDLAIDAVHGPMIEGQVLLSDQDRADEN